MKVGRSLGSATVSFTRDGANCTKGISKPKSNPPYRPQKV